MLGLVIALVLATPTAIATPRRVLAQAGDEVPKVVTMEPENGAVDVDIKKVTKLVVTFDRPMFTRGWSLCGDGPNYPPLKGSPRWDTPKKLVVDVELEPGHDYELSLNCGAKGIRSDKEVPLVPVPWTFSTAPEKLPNQATQKAENKKSFDALQDVLANSYSYYDLRVRNWKKLFQENEAAIVNAKTTRGWARAVAKMLAVTEDIHLYLRLGDRVFGTGSRAVDPLYRRKLLDQYLPVEPAGDNGLQGRTSDGIGYVMIAAWENQAAISSIARALSGLRDCRALIVDVRPNAGGDEIMARSIAAWFVDGVKPYAKHRFREKAGADGFGSVTDRAVTGNAASDQRISVPIAVLTSRYVMSSNESFVLMLRQAKDCTVVGEPTYGSSGCPRPHEMPNGVTILVPSWQDMTLDGKCFEGVGLTPDVVVKLGPNDLESKDPILERALALLRDKVKR
jgi:hypothetical protein